MEHSSFTYNRAKRELKNTEKMISELEEENGRGEREQQLPKITVLPKFTPRPYTNVIRELHKLIHDKDGCFWIYNGNLGIWEQNAEAVLEEELRRALVGEELNKRYVIQEIISDVRGLSFTNEPFPETPSEYVPFKDCIYDLKTGKKHALASEFYLTSKLAIEYDLSTECPTIDRIFSELVPQERVVDLYELIAYCLYRGYPTAKVFFLYGPGRNGKTTFVTILENLLGKNNVSSVSLAESQGNRFASAALFGRYANISPELHYEDLTKTDTIKKLSGGDLIRAEQKFRPAFHFRNHAKLIFVTNELPHTTDTTIAFYSRVHLIEFSYVFEGKQADKNLLARIPAEEYKGLASKCIGILQRMYNENFSFSNEVSVEEMIDKYERLTNPLETFIKENCEKDPDKHIQKWEFREAFQGWQKERGLRIWNDTQIGIKMKSLDCEDGRVTVDGNQRRAWLGLQWKDTAIDTLDTLDTPFYLNIKSNRLNNKPMTNLTTLSSDNHCRHCSFYAANGGCWVKGKVVAPNGEVCEDFKFTDVPLSTRKK